MSDKVVLPIIEAPSLNSYVHHSYPCAIIEDKSICSLYVSNNDEHQWKVENTNAALEYLPEQQILTIENKKGRADTYAVMQRQCGICDEIIVKVNQFVLMDSLSYIRMSVGTQNQYQKEDDVFFRWNQYDITVNERLIAFEGHFDVYYRMRRNENSIEVCASQDKFAWIPVYWNEIEFDYNQDVFFYIKIYYGENYYEYWKNMNFIQMVYNGNDYNRVYLDYFTFPRKRYDASYQEFSYFLDTEYLLMDECLEPFDSIVLFIKDSLRHGYYVNIDIDEQYIPERQDLEPKEYFHFNLVYGYDDEKEVFYALGYKQSGKLSTAYISYHVLVRDIVGKNVVRYKKNINTTPYMFSIDYLLKSLEEYLYGIDSSEKYMGVIGKQKGVYGINVFNELLYTERGRELIVTDRRLSFVLYEHCVNMIDRLNFIDKMGFLDKESREYLFEIGYEMLKASEILKNGVIKNIYKKNMSEKIMFQVNILFELEKKFYGELVKILHNNGKVYSK